MDQECAAGACRPICAAPRRICNGACVDTSSDAMNCGACGMACPMGQVCRSGSCAVDCGALTTCGAECVDLTSSAMHCGRCNNACPMAQTCTMSACRCPMMGQTFCAPSCVDVQRDNNNCGTCGRRCMGGQMCVGGACRCPMGQHWCSGMCVSNNSVNSCGTSSCTPCAAPMNGTATCNGTNCGFTCNAGFMPSGGMCVPTMVTCGNGALDSGEQCDDSNAMSGDGCSSSCQLESNVLTEQCSSPRTPLQISLNQTIRLRGSTSSAISESNACTGPNRALGPDVVFELRLRNPGRVRTTVTPESHWDIVLKGGTMCPGECLDDNPAGLAEGPVMTTRALGTGTTFYLIVDGYDSGDAGDFTLETSLVP